MTPMIAAGRFSLVLALALGLPLLAQAQMVDSQSGAPVEPAADSQPPATQGPSSGITCEVRNGIPTTVSQTRRGEVPIIKWTSSDFDASGWTPDKRCQLVSQRFETFRANGQLQFLTTGRVAGQPVICAVASQSAPCTAADVLYTLKRGQDASATLRRLLNVRRGASGPMSETGARIYVNFNQFLDERMAASSPSARPAKVPSASTRPSTRTPSSAGAAW